MMPVFVRIIRITAKPVEVEPLLGGHKEHLRLLAQRGRLRSAGTLGDMDGFLDVFYADDLHEAERIAAASPLVAYGLCGWSLDRWKETDLD